MKHIRMEDPKYSTLRPEKEMLRNSVSGTVPGGAQIHGSYKQPWVEHDPVAEENPKVG